MTEENIDFGKIKNYCDSNYMYYCRVMAEIFDKSNYTEGTDRSKMWLGSYIFSTAFEPQKLEIGNGKYDQVIFHKSVTDKLSNKSLPSLKSIEVGHRLEVWHAGSIGQSSWNVKDILDKKPSYSDIDVDSFIGKISSIYNAAYRNIANFDKGGCILDSVDKGGITLYPIVPYIAENLPSGFSTSKVNYYKVLYLLFVGGVFNFFKILETLLKRKYLGMYCGGILNEGREHWYYERLAEVYVQIEKIVQDGFDEPNENKSILLKNLLNEYKKVIAADKNIIPSETEETKQSEFKEVGKTGVGLGDVLLGVGLAGVGYGLYKKFKKSRRKSSSKSSESGDESRWKKRRKGHSSSGKKKRVSKRRR